MIGSVVILAVGLGTSQLAALRCAAPDDWLIIEHDPVVDTAPLPDLGRPVHRLRPRGRTLEQLPREHLIGEERAAMNPTRPRGGPLIGQGWSAR